VGLTRPESEPEVVLNIHEIRLRRAWTWRADGRIGRIDLPIDRSQLPDGPFTLERAYRAPKLGEQEAIWLTVDHTPELLELRVDGFAWDLQQPLPAGGPHRLEIDIAASHGRGMGWGDFRIAVRRVDVAVGRDQCL